MDPDTERIIERTRQRRAMLDQKFGKTPDPAPRKRFLEDTTNQPVQKTVEDDSPKRQRTWEADGHGKSDTPAIKSVQSRMAGLATDRQLLEGTNDGDMKENRSRPVAMETDHNPTKSPAAIKSRFAKLAQDLDEFECDMSHPRIKKEEEKKTKWQPPKRDDGVPPNNHNFDAKDRHVSSPQKEYELYQGPKRNNSNGSNPAPSPKKTQAPAPPMAPPLQDMPPAKPPRAPSPLRARSPARAPVGSPHVSTHTVNLQQPQNVASPKFTHHVRTMVNQEPVNKRADDSTSGDEPTEKPVTDRLATWKKAAGTPSKPKEKDPTETPLSERFAGWEQRVTQTPKADSTPARRPPQGQRQITTPSHVQQAAGSQGYLPDNDPAAKPVSDIRASWKEADAKSKPAREEEPTAYSVNDRMSAWETMSSSNQVSNIKKVDPGSNKGPTWKPTGTPNKGLTPQKSFKESIEERASQMGRGKAVEGLPPRPPAPNNSAARSPVRSPSKVGGQSPTVRVPSPQAASPTGRVGGATRSLQQKILEQVQHSKTDMLADKLRQERMAEVNALNNRYQNGILKDDRVLETKSSAEENNTAPPPAPPAPSARGAAKGGNLEAKGGNLDPKSQKRETIRDKARDAFNSKLQAMGFELSDEGASSYPVNPKDRQPSSATKKPSSIYRLVSKRSDEEEKPVVKQQSSSSLKKVQFQDTNSSFDSQDSQERTDDQVTETDSEGMDETEDSMDPTSEGTQSESQDSFEETYDGGSGSESSIPESYKSPSKRGDYRPSPQRPPIHDMDSDDVSLSAFVPASVRRESLMPPPGRVQEDTGSGTSEDSFDREEHEQQPCWPGASYDMHVDYPKGGTKQQHVDESGNSDDDSCDRQEMDDLLDEAFDDISKADVELRNKEPVPHPRKRQSHMYATTEGAVGLPKDNNNEVTMRAKSDGLAYSVSMYRTSRHTKIRTTVDFRDHLSAECPPVVQRIVRNSEYTHQAPREEDIQMPSQLPLDMQRKTIDERIKELNELVTQEQSVIMQTSNALNQCCMGDSQFAGSTEQVECNRLLLVSCQRRQAYLTEAQRLKETRQLEPANQQGPKGSLSISDIRLPLKKDFVTKIGTATDNTTHYFVILIRNGPQVITTQMLSTHDPLMRGSLDFPNLIKIHGISANFNINLEIYSMSVSREHVKDKKKKTPKKQKHQSHMPLESPGGPLAVRTTSFFLITTLPITMRSLDKSSFNLERIPYLSPLHGMIYMRLKCMMEQHVEERGFLTMFEDVEGLGSWHRRWCVLSGNKLCYWKYPDDENKKDPMGYIDMKRVITEKAGLMPRDICARPNTFELVSVRPPMRGEQDTLVTKTYNTMTTTRFMLSADTKEERIVWCNKINRALANIRTWHADAMRPIKAPK
ncbi:anillin-like isoform X2 [Dreissena polymorpha]|uniref:anillin-like isoform X2 n=1 Tax=Dreissena polymorpha TaxID=45954 RepID=UPI00226517B8|nr:anillin-like isoform X2 [Dreissena polymorpha]